jgi:hypothetical protein
MAANPEILDDVEYEDVTGLDPQVDSYFTGEGRDDPKDDWNSESDTVKEGPDDIQTRPVSSLDKKSAFAVLQRWWYNDSDFSADWRRGATEALGFVAGDQLSDEDKALLDSQNRPYVVFNRTLTVLKAVAGMEINGRHEITFLPEENDDTVVAEILSGTSKWMGQQCDGEDEQSSAFQQCCVTGIGVTESRFSFEEKSNGQYVEEMFDCREFYWGRTARKKNLADAPRMWRVRRMALSDAMQLCPGYSRRQLDATWADVGSDYDSGPRSIEEKRVRDGKNSYLDWDDTNEVTIVCGEWWEREPYYLVADEVNQRKVEVSIKEFRLLKRLAMLRGAPAPNGVRLTRKVFKRVFLGNEILGEIKPAPLGNQFSWGVVTGEWDAKKRQWFGMVRTLEDPQKWANKFMSQVMHIMNSTAKGGIIAETDAFDDQIDAEEGYAMADQITWVKPGALSQGAKPKIMPKPGQGDASAYVALLQYAVSAIKDVTGINPELLGQQDMQQPGVVEHMRKQAGMTVLATMFDALRRYRKILGRKRLWVIQNRLSDGRIIRVVGQQYTGAVKLAKDMTAGEYDVSVADAPTSPNMKEANWAIIQPLLAVFKDQLMAQPEVLAQVLEYSPLPSQLVQAIKRIITTAQNDPEKQAEQQKVKELTFAKLLSEVSKNDSTANLNNAKAGTATATAAYDVAIAQNMMHDNALQRGKLAIDAKKADQDAEIGKIKAVGELAKVHGQARRDAIDAVNARTKHIEAWDKMHTNRVGVLASAHHDLASAFHKRVAGLQLARTPPAVTDER